jgi:hypothetical protein
MGKLRGVSFLLHTVTTTINCLFSSSLSLAPIVMSPFVFPDNLEEGMRASVVCSVVSGDPPISIKWFKDGQDIEKSLDSIQIVSITEFVSSLSSTDSIAPLREITRAGQHQRQDR